MILDKKNDIKRAAEKLIWRLKPSGSGEYKSFTPNKDDVDSLNCLLQWVNNQKKETFDNNHLFAKLYIYHLTMNIRYFETTILDPVPQEDLSRILDTPIKHFYKAFEEDLYNNQLNRLLKKGGSEEQDKIIKDYISQKNLYTSEVIQAQLSHMVTEALNRF